MYKMMHFVVILISLYLFAETCVECSGNISSVNLDKNATSYLNDSESERALHNRLKVHGEKNMDAEYHFTAMITWYLTQDSSNGTVEVLPFKCSSVIVSRFWLLTAATCFQSRILFEVRRKQRGETLIITMEDGVVTARAQTRITSQVYVHADHIEIASRGDVDVALVKLRTPLSMYEATTSRYVSVARLGANFADTSDVVNDCEVVSYSEYAETAKPPYSKKLNTYDVYASGPKYCQVLQEKLDANKYFPNGYFVPGDKTTDDTFDSFFICATRNSFKRYEDGKQVLDVGCFGDVGGALVCRRGPDDVVVGILSTTFSRRFCVDDGIFTTFMSVGHEKVYRWMKKYVGDLPGLRATYDESEIENETVSSAITTVSNKILICCLLLALSAIAFSL